jgi:hypothetical protein
LAAEKKSGLLVSLKMINKEEIIVKLTVLKNKNQKQI